MIVFIFLGVLGFWDLDEVLFLLVEDLGGPDSQAVMALRSNMLVSEGMVYLESVFELCGSEVEMCFTGSFKGRFAC